ncbi:unnamed protein product [Caenorhabditis brenneri]
MKRVEKILTKRTNQDGGEEYLVKWDGLPHWECSWEPLASLDCEDKLEEFRKQKDEKNRKVDRVKEDFLARWQGAESEDSWVSPSSGNRFSEFKKQAEELSELKVEVQNNREKPAEERMATIK